MIDKFDWPDSPCLICEHSNRCNWYKTCDAFRSWVRKTLARFRRLAYKGERG